jgi:hypothetical protein
MNLLSIVDCRLRSVEPWDWVPFASSVSAFRFSFSDSPSLCACFYLA